jgi:hypothetical protein
MTTCAAGSALFERYEQKDAGKAPVEVLSMGFEPSRSRLASRSRPIVLIAD